MKKLFLVAAIAVFGISTTYAQTGLEVGVNFALPVGDLKDISTFTLGFDMAYLFEVSEKFEAGIATGFTNAFGDSYNFLGQSYDYDDVQFIPVALALRLYPTENLYLGGDIGYAIGINDGNDGGFYYRPRIGYSLTDFIGVNVSYTGISLDGGGEWETIGLGFEFSF